MTPKHALLAVPVLLTLGLLWLVVREGGSEINPVEAPAPEGRAVVADDFTLEIPEREATVPELATPAMDGGRVASPLPETGVEDKEPELAHLVGRFLLPDGNPAEGVALLLRGYIANTDRKQKYGEPEDWINPESTTDAEGRFDIAFDPPRAYQFFLGAKLEGYAALSWRWSALPRREVTNVGQQTFQLTGTVSGRVVGPDGSPTGTGWMVYAKSTSGPTGTGAGGTSVRVAAELDTGAFRLEGLPPGSVQLKAYARIANWVTGPVVQVRAGEETQADIVYEGPDNSRRITVGVSSRLFHVFGDLEQGSVTCTADDGRAVAGSRIPRSAQSYSFEDLEPGTYTIEVSSPLYQPWSRSGVQPGEQVNARLKGNAAITLVVRDGETGDEVVDYGLRLRYEGATFSPNTFQVRKPDEERPTGGLYEGLIPFDTTLIVEAQGFAPLELAVGELAPGSTNYVEGELVRGGTLRGVVTQGNGDPVARAAVLLHPHLADYDPDNVFSWPSGMSEVSAFKSRSQEAETDVSGRFLIEGVTPGDYDVRASHSGVSAKLEHVAIASATMEDVVIRLPGTGAIAGRLKGPPNAEFGRLQLLALPRESDPRRLQTVGRLPGSQLPQTVVGEGGSFRLAPVLEGPCAVFLTMPAENQPASVSGSYHVPGAFLELGEALVVAGAETSVNFDLTAIFPGTIVMDVRVNGERAPGSVITAVQRVEGRKEARMVGRLDAESRVRLFPLFTGDWLLYVKPAEGGWSYVHPAKVALGPAGEVELVIDIIVASGRVRILDAADGSPLAKRHVWVGQGRTYITDDEGWLDLRLTPGTHSLRDAGHGRDWAVETTPLDWTSDGPVQEEVRLTLVEGDGQ